jgi:hypothetical protein
MTSERLQWPQSVTIAHMIDALLRPFALAAAEVTTLSTPGSQVGVDDPNAVTVVTGNDRRALYLSRATILYNRGIHKIEPCWSAPAQPAFRRVLRRGKIYATSMTDEVKIIVTAAVASFFTVAVVEPFKAWLQRRRARRWLYREIMHNCASLLA